MTRLPVRALTAGEVADLVADLEQTQASARTLAPLGQAYGVEAAVIGNVLGLLEDLLRRPPLEA